MPLSIAYGQDCRALLLESFDPFAPEAYEMKEVPHATFASDYARFQENGALRPKGELSKGHLQWLLKNTPHESIHHPIEWLVGRGFGVNTLLKKFKIPKKLHKYYDKDTGKFNYHRETPLLLQPENGDRPIELLRLNFREEYTQVYRGFLRDLQQALHMDSHLRIVILYARGSKKSLKALVKEELSDFLPRIEIKPVSGKDLIEPYAQDDSKPAQGKVLVRANIEYSDLKRHATKYETALEALESHGQKMEDANFYFHGGDIVVGDRHIFVGKNLISLAQKNLRISQAAAIRMFEAEFGKKVFMVGAELAKDLFVQMDFDKDKFLVSSKLRQNCEANLKSPKPLMG